MTLPVGTVIKYNDYPHGIDGIKKPYWFIILGRTPLLFEPQYYYMFKTTTQMHYYERTTGDRRNSPHKILECKTYTCFDSDCCVDFDLPIFERHTIPEIKSFIDKGKVEVKGRLDSILPELYYLSIKGKGAIGKVKEHFHNSFNIDGVTGLSLPKTRDKNYYRNKYLK